MPFKKIEGYKCFVLYTNPIVDNVAVKKGDSPGVVAYTMQLFDNAAEH